MYHYKSQTIKWELQTSKEHLELNKELLASLGDNMNELLPFLKEDVMENYDFREMRKTLVTMFSFDEINLLDDEMGDEVRSEVYREQRLDTESNRDSTDRKQKNKGLKIKRKVCQIF
jgi:hypothetical protein